MTEMNCVPERKNKKTIAKKNQMTGNYGKKEEESKAQTK